MFIDLGTDADRFLNIRGCQKLYGNPSRLHSAGCIDTRTDLEDYIVDRDMRRLEA